AGPRNSFRHGKHVGLRLADGESRRLHLRLLYQRSGSDQGVPRGCHHRKAAPGADSGLPRGACGGDGFRRAGLLDLRRRTNRIRDVSRTRCRRRACGHGGRVRRAGHRNGQVDRAGAVRRRARGEQPMKFASTRGQAPHVSFSQALLTGLAPDGGLYVPQQWPDLSQLRPASLPELGRTLIGSVAGDDALAAQLPQITADAFNFPAPLKPLGSAGYLSVLELFHGPTAAFKDFGARFLAASLARIPRTDSRPLRILVATSGDTGGAVAAAFHRRPGMEVVVLFPKGLVSPTQQQQLTCWGENVTSLAVRGSFDDCQRLVKEAFVDESMRARAQMSSANSINLGRLLPQAVYYAASSLEVHNATGGKASYIIPSGNLGNAAACIWARRMGLPIDRIVLDRK